MQADPDLLLQSGALLEFVAGLIVGGVAMRLLIRAFSPSEGRRLRGGPQRGLRGTGGTGVTGSTGPPGAPTLPRLLGALGKGLVAALVEADRQSKRRRELAGGSSSGTQREARAELAQLFGAVRGVTGQATAAPKELPRAFVEAEARRMVATGSVMDAIAFVRQATGMGLAESKEYVTRLKR